MIGRTWLSGIGGGTSVMSTVPFQVFEISFGQRMPKSGHGRRGSFWTS